MSAPSVQRLRRVSFALPARSRLWMLAALLAVPVAFAVGLVVGRGAAWGWPAGRGGRATTSHPVIVAEPACMRGYGPACAPIYAEARRRCEAGSAADCVSAAVMVQAGRGTPKDLVAAQSLLVKACAGSIPEGCHAAGLTYLQGGVSKDASQAFAFFQRACSAGHQPACTNQAFMLETGEAGTGDNSLASAVALYRRTCAKGEMTACNNLGHFYESGTEVERDTEAAARLYRAACDGAVGRACRNLGMLFEAGTGAAPDPVAAAELYRQSCGLGEAEGCTSLGNLYVDGQGIAADPARGFDLFKEGCLGGDGVGCNNVGALYEAGEGRPKNVAQAFAYYDIACESGMPEGCDSAAELLQNGRLPKDPEAVRRYKKRAAEFRSMAAP